VLLCKILVYVLLPNYPRCFFYFSSSCLFFSLYFSNSSSSSISSSSSSQPSKPSISSISSKSSTSSESSGLVGSPKPPKSPNLSTYHSKNCSAASPSIYSFNSASDIFSISLSLSVSIDSISLLFLPSTPTCKLATSSPRPSASTWNSWFADIWSFSYLASPVQNSPPEIYGESKESDLVNS